MSVPTVCVVHCTFVELNETGLCFAPSITGVFEIGIVFLRSIAVVVVVTFFQSCEGVEFESRNGFDVQGSLYRAAEVVTVLIGLFLVGTSDRVGLS